MYLSKIDLKLSLLKNPYEWHREIWRLFPEKDGENRDFLFRLEGIQEENKSLVVLLQSTVPPQQQSKLGRLISGPSPINFHSLQEGGVYRFKLVANVTKKIKEADTRRPLRVPLMKEEEQIAWIKRKFENAADLLEVQIKINPALYFRKNQMKGKLQTLTFEGFLKIINLPSTIRLLNQGIGPAKGFGCGLLSLAG